jgi:hypothetical protein
MPTLSYDFHVHPGPSTLPRWGDGLAVWEAALAAGVHGFVWKAHERHTVGDVRQLPEGPVWAIASASLNPWSSLESVDGALAGGALWVWGPTQTPEGQLGWELPLPGYWPELHTLLEQHSAPLVLASGHLGAEGRRAFAALAAEHPQLICSVTHSLFTPRAEALELAEAGCLFEIDAYTYTVDLGRPRANIRERVEELVEAGALVYFTSDGGQAATGNPFTFGAEALDRIATEIGHELAELIGVTNPTLVAERVGSRRAT